MEKDGGAIENYSIIKNTSSELLQDETLFTWVKNQGLTLRPVLEGKSYKHYEACTWQSPVILFDNVLTTAGALNVNYINIDGTNTYVHGKKYRDNYNYLYNLINPVSKQKQGGKMNRIKYFQRGGKNLPTAPDAKEAYKGGTYISGRKSDKIIGPAKDYYVPRQITRTIGPNSDTTDVERPKYFVPEGEAIHVKLRKANSLDKDRTEYEILNRRFNEAASVSKKQQGGQMQQQGV